MVVPVLRIKNQQGQIVDIPAIKGDKGGFDVKDSFKTSPEASFYEICFSDNTAIAFGKLSPAVASSEKICDTSGGKAMYLLSFYDIENGEFYPNEFTSAFSQSLEYAPATVDSDVFVSAQADFTKKGIKNIKAIFIRSSASSADEIAGKLAFTALGKCNYQNFT